MFRIILPLLILISSTSLSAQSNWIGLWTGSMDIQGIKLKLNFEIKKGNTDKYVEYVSYLSVPQQGAKDIPMGETHIKRNKISISSKILGLQFHGKLSKDGKSINGTFKQHGQTFNLILESLPNPAEIQRQTIKTPIPYNSRQFQFSHENGFIRFFGTLTYPKNFNDTTPVVILISGSGSQDRDETILGHKPFLILADYLTRTGLAVLRVDDRGAGETKTKPSELDYTTQDMVSDVQNYIRFIADSIGENHPLFLIGHSEGARIASEIAVKNSAVKKVIGFGPALVKGAEINKYQNLESLNRILEDSILIIAYLKLHDELIKLTTTDKSQLSDPVTLDSLIQSAIEKWKHTTDKSIARKIRKRFERKMKPDFDTYIKIQYRRLIGNKWMRYFINDDPIIWWKLVKQPVLLINGDLDRQTPLELNKPAFKKHLEAKKNISYEILKGINHLGQTATTGHPAEYGEIHTTIEPHILKRMELFLIN